jgi:hypothetical protein
LRISVCQHCGRPGLQDEFNTDTELCPVCEEKLADAPALVIERESFVNTCSILEARIALLEVQNYKLREGNEQLQVQIDSLWDIIRSIANEQFKATTRRAS